MHRSNSNLHSYREYLRAGIRSTASEGVEEEISESNIEIYFYPIVHLRINGRAFANLVSNILHEVKKRLKVNSDESLINLTALINLRINEGIHKFVEEEKAFFNADIQTNIHGSTLQVDYQVITHTLDGWMLFNPYHSPMPPNGSYDH